MDTSFAIPWIFADEVNPLSDEAWRELVARKVSAHVPGLWPMEVVNVTLRGPRNQKPKPSEKDIEAFFAVVRRMPLRVHFQGLDVFVEEAVPLMRKYKLTAYDTAYLLLAKSMKLPLASCDDRMRKAAASEGIEVLE